MLNPPPPTPSFCKLEKVFTVQKYIAPNFQNYKKKCGFCLFFFFQNFDLLKIFFKLLLSTCLHFKTGLKLL